MNQTTSSATDPPDDSGSHRKHRLSQRGWRRILWWGGLAILSGVWLLVQYVQDGFGWPFWMIGPVVFSAARLVLIGTTAGIMAWIGCFVLWVKYPPPESERWLDKAARAGTVTIVVIVALVLLALDGSMALLETSDAFQPIHVLSQASPGGCRLVLWREPNDGYDQWRHVYVFLKVPGSMKLRQVTESVLYPDSSVHWTLTWHDNRARLAGWEIDNHRRFTWNDALATPVVCPVP